MTLQDLNSGKINLYVSDDTETISADEAGELTKLLNNYLEVAEDFLWKNCDHIDLNKLDVSSIELSLNICGNEEIIQLNEEYRGKSKVTDVLSFQLHDSLRSSSESLDSILNLGDIIICKEVALKQSEEFKISYAQEVLHLFVHGFLHLCGFDHEASESEENIMFKIEEELVSSIYKSAGLEK